MRHTFLKSGLCLLLAVIIAVGLIPGSVLAAGTAATGTPGESAENPILISTMDQLIEEMERDVTTPTYYKLTEDISHETSIEYLDGREDCTGDDGYTTVRTPQMAQCVVGTGKKFLELDGHDIHYKNNVNFSLGDATSRSTRGGPKYCVVTDQYGKTATTDTVTLRMAATVTTQPKTTYTKRGATATVTVTAAGDGVKYQWYVKNAGASTWVKSSITASTYSVKMASASKDRQVYCVITDKYGNKVKTKTVTLSEK